MVFKDRIKELRIEKSLSYTQLASLFNKTESAARAWELGRTKPDVETLIKLASYFECSTDYLLGISNIRNQAMVKSMSEQNEMFMNNLTKCSNSDTILKTLTDIFDLVQCTIKKKEDILQSLEKLLRFIYCSLLLTWGLQNSFSDKGVLRAYKEYADGLLQTRYAAIHAIDLLFAGQFDEGKEISLNEAYDDINDLIIFVHKMCIDNLKTNLSLDELRAGISFRLREQLGDEWGG